MGRYIKATAKKNFLCAWKCSACSTINVEEPQAEMFAREDITFFQKEDAAREKARARAGENLNDYLEKIPVLVNEKMNYNPLGKCGQCSKCSAQQPWAKEPKFILILLIPVVLLAIAALVMFRDHIPFVLFGGLMCFLAAIFLGDRLNVRSRRRKAEEMSDEHCRPLAITTKVPDYVSRDDPRLLAIVAHISAKNKSA